MRPIIGIPPHRRPDPRSVALGSVVLPDLLQYEQLGAVQVRHDRHVGPDSLGGIVPGREVMEMKNQRVRRPNPFSGRRQPPPAERPTQRNPAKMRSGAPGLSSYDACRPRLVHRSVTVVLRGPGSIELGKQIVQLNGGPQPVSLAGLIPASSCRYVDVMIDAEKGRDLCKVLGLDIAASD